MAKKKTKTIKGGGRSIGGLPRKGSRTKEERAEAKKPTPPRRRKGPGPIVRGVIADSPLASEHTKRLYGMALQACVDQLLSLEAKRNQFGVLASDEARTIPALMSNMHRLCTAIGVVKLADPDEGDL